MRGAPELDPAVFAEWGEVLVTSGLQDDAAVLLEEPVKQHPENLSLRLAFVRALIAEGDRAAAGALVEEALVLPSANVERATLLAFRAGFFIDAGQPESALESAREAVRFHPEGPPALFALAVSARANGDLKQARDAVEELLRVAPELANARLARALVELAEGCREATEGQLRGAGDPAREGLMSALGDLLLRGARDPRDLERFTTDLVRGPRREGWRRRIARRAERLHRSRGWKIALAGVALAAPLLGALGYPAAYALLPIALVAWGTFILRVPDELREHRRSRIAPKRFWGGVLAFVMLFFFGGLLVVGILDGLDSGWSEGRAVAVLVVGAISALSLWALWRIVRGGYPRHGPGLPCACSTVLFMSGGQARRFATSHLGEKGRNAPMPVELACPTTGARWLRYDVDPVGSGSIIARLVRERGPIVPREVGWPNTSPTKTR
jgi:tetratricopeptide (TPR) repeat protein